MVTSSTASERSNQHKTLSHISCEDAFRTVTGAALADPNELQQALYPRLITQDTGLLIPTGPGAGRLEAVAVPSLLGMQVGEAAHRLFIVSSDLRPLDDYSYRLATYIKNLVKSDKIERTLWLEEPNRPPIARTYQPDGSILNGAADHPFSESVDIVVMPLSHFRATFFGSGGVHAMPEAAGYDNAAAQSASPRGLIYFDDAFGSTQEERDEFVKFVEYLFAQDLDIVVGSSSLPLSLRQELSALEIVDVKSAQGQPKRTVSFTSVVQNELLQTMEQKIFANRSASDRIGCVFNSLSDSRMATLAEKLRSKGVPKVFLYQTNMSRTEREKLYAQILSLQKANQGFTLVTDGPGLEASDFDLTKLICEECEPIEFVRRAARCNRYGRIESAAIGVLGEGPGPSGVTSDIDLCRQIAFAKALRDIPSEVEFDSMHWESFLD